MKQLEQRRIVPISIITMILFSIMGLFQLFVIAGGYELEASTVQKIAPWAYEPFLKLVGEHPDTRPAWAIENRTKELEEQPSPVTVAGIDPESISVDLNLDPMPTNTIIEATVPVDEPKPAKKSGEVIPVG